MTDFEDRLASIAERRQAAQIPDERSGATDWSQDPDLFDRETKRDIKNGVIGTVLGASTVILGGIATVATADMLDWDWAAIAIPPGTKLGAILLGVAVFCIAGLMIGRVGRIAMAAGFGFMLAAEPRLAHHFPETWLRLYQVDIGLDRGARVAQLYVADPDDPLDGSSGPLASMGGLDALFDEWTMPSLDTGTLPGPTEEITLEADAAIGAGTTAPTPGSSGKTR